MKWSVLRARLATTRLTLPSGTPSFRAILGPPGCLSRTDRAARPAGLAEPPDCARRGPLHLGGFHFTANGCEVSTSDHCADSSELAVGWCGGGPVPGPRRPRLTERNSGYMIPRELCGSRATSRMNGAVGRPRVEQVGSNHFWWTLCISAAVAIAWASVARSQDSPFDRCLHTSPNAASCFYTPSSDSGAAHQPNWLDLMEAAKPSPWKWKGLGPVSSAPPAAL